MEIVVISHVGTWVLIPFAVGELVFVLTVTTAEQLVNLVSTIDGSMAGRHLSSIAAAIDLLDTGQLAAVDDDLGLFFGLLEVAFSAVSFGTVWLEGSQIAAAIDGHHIILLE